MRVVNVAQLGALEVADPTGSIVRIADTWEHQAVVIAFLRHFGCLHCREFASQLRDSYDAIVAQGADVVAIGTGNPEHGRDLMATMGVPFRVLIDADGRAARAAAVHTLQPSDLFRPTVWRNARRVRRAGFHQSKTGARPMQLGAQFVIAPGGELRFAHLERTPSDHASIAALLAAL